MGLHTRHTFSVDFLASKHKVEAVTVALEETNELLMGQTGGVLVLCRCNDAGNRADSERTQMLIWP